MRNVRCHECGKRYNYDVDDFCPRCGAFTLPKRTARIGADGTVVRVDGINEQNHRRSFVHAELHEENRERRGTRLESAKEPNPAFDRRKPYRRTGMNSKSGKPGSIAFWIIFAIIAFNLLSQLLFIFL